MKPSEIRNVLEDHEVRPSKSLGQNFLTDENVARWIVGQLEIQPQDCVVEVLSLIHISEPTRPY